MLLLPLYFCPIPTFAEQPFVLSLVLLVTSTNGPYRLVVCLHLHWQPPILEGKSGARVKGVRIRHVKVKVQRLCK